jgi:ketosteroid isomerase-like protein
VEVERVTRLEQERIQANLKKDKSWFDYNLADDLTAANSEGVLENKAQLIARCLDPANILDSETYDGLVVRAYGDVMIATGKLLQNGKSSGSEYNVQRRFTDVWVNRAGRWRQVATHVSLIRADDGASQSAAETQKRNPVTAPPLESPPGTQPSPATNTVTPSPSPQSRR